MTLKRVLIALVLSVVLIGRCDSTSRKSIGGRWSIVTEHSPLPDSGGHHPYLHRRLGWRDLRVDDDTYDYRFVPPDAVLWIGLDNGGLWLATGDHQPVLLKRNLAPGERVPAGDTIDLDRRGTFPITALIDLASREPLLTRDWHPMERGWGEPVKPPRS
jgi:hypothetical protein